MTPNLENAGLRLSEYIQAHINKPFKWGENDCILFAVSWLQLETGKDFLTEHKPWRTAREASKKLRDLGGILVLFNKKLLRINQNMARDGDLTIHQGAAHLFSGRHIVSVGHTGLVFTERGVAQAAWRHTCHQ